MGRQSEGGRIIQNSSPRSHGKREQTKRLPAYRLSRGSRLRQVNNGLCCTLFSASSWFNGGFPDYSRRPASHRCQTRPPGRSIPLITYSSACRLASVVRRPLRASASPASSSSSSACSTVAGSGSTNSLALAHQEQRQQREGRIAIAEIAYQHGERHRCAGTNRGQRRRFGWIDRDAPQVGHGFAEHGGEAVGSRPRPGIAVATDDGEEAGKQGVDRGQRFVGDDAARHHQEPAAKASNSGALATRFWRMTTNRSGRSRAVIAIDRPTPLSVPATSPAA